MLFNDLFEKLSPFILDEKYHPYDIPTKKQDFKGDIVNLQAADTNKYMMYDFYVLDYLKYLIDNMSPKQFRDLNPDLEDSVQDAVKKLYPHLREELLDAVFYSMCAEFRNSTQVSTVANLQKLPKGSKERKLYADWLKYMKVHRGAYTGDDLETLGVEKPSSKVRAPELEKNNTADRNLSYKAANYSIEENGVPKSEFVKMMEEVFSNGAWNSSYGGRAWGRIAEGWLSLNASDKLTPQTKQSVDSIVKPMNVAIDHVYDLQHNTDTVFNKLKSYYSQRNDYTWIKQALDDKANAESYHDLLKHSSGAVKSMALPVLYNRLGTPWEDHVRKNRPNDLYDRAAEEKKAQEALELKQQQDANEASLLAKLKAKNGKQDREPSTSLDEVNPQNTKAGDIILCVDNTGMEKRLTVGKEYLVNKIEANTVNINNNNNSPMSSFFFRFKTTGKKTKDLTSMKIYTPEEMHNFEDVDDTNTKAFDTVLAFQLGGVEKYLVKGKAYIVKEIGSATLKVTDESGNTHDYSNWRFKKIPTPSDEYATWKDGDFIKCVDNEGYAQDTLDVGNVYIVKGKPVPVTDSPGQYFISVLDTEHNMMGSFNTNRFVNVTKKIKRKATSIKDEDTALGISPVKDKHDFKLGDKVKRKGTELVGEVIRLFRTPVNGDGLKVKLHDGKGTTVYWKPRNTEHVVDPTIYPTPDNSKAGDMVLCIDDEHETHFITKGKEYEIVEFDPGYVRVKDNYGQNSMWYTMERFEVIPQKERAPKSKYKVGDRVTYTTDEPKVYHGHVNEIKSVPHNPTVLLKIYFKELQDAINIQETDPMLKKAPSTFATQFNNEELEIGDDVFAHVHGNTFYGKLTDKTKNQGHVKFPPQHGEKDAFSIWFALSKITKDIKI